MCTNTRLIRNKYTGKMVRVKCGKCDACKQEKANSVANRIRNHSKHGEIALFVTLTYDNRFVPYVRRDELGSIPLNVYRDYRSRYVNKNLKVSKGTHVVGTCVLDDLYDFKYMPYLSRQSDTDKIGVCFYNDLQNFFKRLRINLKRDNYERSISYFGCSEYGSITKRPHFHLLIYCSTDDVEKISSFIVKSWTYADSGRTSKYIEIARDAASYVASYVNCAAGLSSDIQKSVFKQKHSMSKDFGCRCDCFTLSSVLDMLYRGDLSYRTSSIKDGLPCGNDIILPKYVINRYFPRFKGYSLISPDEMAKLLLVPSRLRQRIKELDSRFEWNDSDFHSYVVRMIHIMEKFMAAFSWSVSLFESLYPELYIRIWSLWFSQANLQFYDGYNEKLSYFYENLSEVFAGRIKSDIPDFLCSVGFSDDDIIFNPNERFDIVAKDRNLCDIFRKKNKFKKVMNSVMSDLGYDV